MNPKLRALGIATGEFMRRLLERQGRFTVGYVWNYRTRIPRETFLPHRALDGTRFKDFEDTKLSNDTGFPKTAHYFPGDHKGCRCKATPRIVTIDGRRA